MPFTCNKKKNGCFNPNRLTLLPFGLSSKWSITPSRPTQLHQGTNGKYTNIGPYIRPTSRRCNFTIQYHRTMAIWPSQSSPKNASTYCNPEVYPTSSMVGFTSRPSIERQFDSCRRFWGGDKTLLRYEGLWSTAVAEKWYYSLEWPLGSGRVGDYGAFCSMLGLGHSKLSWLSLLDKSVAGETAWTAAFSHELSPQGLIKKRLQLISLVAMGRVNEIHTYINTVNDQPIFYLMLKRDFVTMNMW